MTYLDVFCFSYSIRLGSILTGVLSIIQALFPVLIIWINGVQIFRVGGTYIQAHMKELNFEMYINLLEKDSQTFIGIALAIVAVYIAACGMEILGSFKLKKWLLFPYMILEAIRLVVLLLLHCLTMMVLKKNINLGALIGSSVAGAFIILFLGYLWICVVSLFQIIIIIKTPEYISMYGKDPMKEPPQMKAKMFQVLQSHRPANKIEKIQIYSSSNFKDLQIKLNDNMAVNHKNKDSVQRRIEYNLFSHTIARNGLQGIY